MINSNKLLQNTACTNRCSSIRRAIRRFILPPLVSTVSIFVATGCNPVNSADFSAEAFNHQQSGANARAQIGRWIPANTTMDDATQILAAHGFECSKLRPLPPDLPPDILAVTDCRLSAPPLSRQKNA